MGLHGPAIVTSPSGKGVVVIGGETGGETVGIDSRKKSKAMFELSQSMEWTRLEQTLEMDHWAHLAIPIPDELVSKQD